MQEEINDLVSDLQNNFGYEIPAELNSRDRINSKELIKCILKEQDVEKRNSILCFLLEKENKDIVNAIWNNIPTNDESYICCDKLHTFIDHRKYISDEHSRLGMNSSFDIDFEGGSIVPLSTLRGKELLAEVETERKDTRGWYDYEIESFEKSFRGFSRGLDFYQGSGLNFAIISPYNDLMGYIGLEPINTFGPISSKYTYNLSYYMVPAYRNLGFMNAALKAFIKELSNSRITAYHSGNKTCSQKDDFYAQDKPLKVHIVVATAVVENIASIKLIESLNFEKSGTVKWARKIGEDESDEIADYDAEENIEICTSAFYTKVIV